VTDDSRTLTTADREQGWLGLELLDQGRVDWNIVSMLGGDAACVRVSPGSPCYFVGIETGDYITSFNGNKTYDDFHKAGLRPDEKVIIKFVRNGIATLVEVVIGRKPKAREQPAKKAKNALPAAVQSGELVTKEKKFRWPTGILTDGTISPLEKSLLALLALRYVNRQCVAYPSTARLASDLGVARRSVISALSSARRRGLLVLALSGKSMGNTSHYALTWPVGEPSNVTKLPVRPASRMNMGEGFLRGR
jgi:hypothetical protein